MLFHRSSVVIIKISYKNLINANSVRHFTPRRAMMYVPGDDKRKLKKAFGLDVDSIAMDCEDGVAINKKEAARDTIRDVLDTGKPFKKRPFDWGLRVNSIDSGLCEKDLALLLAAKNLPDSLLLPKVENIEHIQWFSERADQLIPKNKHIDLVIFIESATAMINLVEICKKTVELSEKIRKFALSALVFGSDDLCASIGVTRTESNNEILYARQKLVLVAKAFKLQAIDMVYIQYKDLEGLKKNCEEGARMGYTGKQVIHPGQVPTVQEVFIPNEKQVEWASGLLKQFEEHQRSGKGAFTYRGSMIDMPTMKQAQNIMQLISSVKNIN